MPRSSPPPPPSSRPPRGRHHHPKGHHAKGRRHGDALDAGPIDAALAAIVPHDRDRAFVLRCILDEGPRHHRVASFALLRMLAAVLAEVGGADADVEEESETAPLEIRLPPSVAAQSDDPEFPVTLPTRMIRELMDRKEAELAIECLREGPAHHALANAVMTWMVQAIFDRVRSSRA